MRIRVGFMLIRRRGKKERALKGTVIIIENWDIRVSGAIVKPSDVRVEEIALCVWGKACVRTRFAEIERKKGESAHTTRFFFSPSISNNSPGMTMNYGCFGDQNEWEVLYVSRRAPNVCVREARALVCWIM